VVQEWSKPAGDVPVTHMALRVPRMFHIERIRSRRMLFDQDEHKRTMKVVAIVLTAVFLIGMFALGGVLLFT
jgi:hypothetical protein